MAVLKYKDSATGTYKSLVNYSIQGLTPVSTTGNSSTDVMSQYAVTTELNKKADANNVYTIDAANSTFMTPAQVTSAVNTIVYGSATPTEALSVITDKDLEQTLANYVNKIGVGTTDYTATNGKIALPEFLTAITKSQVENVLTGVITSHSHNYTTKSEVKSDTDIAKAITETTYNSGHSTSTNIASVPVTKRLSIVSISANGSLNLDGSLADGQELHAIVKNGSGSEITVTIPTTMSGKTVVQMSGDKLTVAGNGYADINIVFDGTNYYVRAL